MKPVTPRGFCDIMPEAALRREKITRAVSDVLAVHGYLPVETPLLEDRRSLEQASHTADTPFQLFDHDGRLLVVRSDLTMPIARLAATRLNHSASPLRLRYAAPVVREQTRFMGLSRQFTQLGAELIGDEDGSADIEVVSLAAEALSATGVKNWRIVCGSVKPLNLLLKAAGLNQTEREKVLACIHASDFVKLDELISSFALSDAVAQALSELPRINGGVEALDEVRALLSACAIDENYVDESIDELAKLFTAAQALRFTQRLVVDFSIINSFDYYTGLVFSIYNPGLPTALGSGGRYDEVFSRLGGRDLPAAGFALSLDLIETALQQQEESRPLRIAVPKGSLFKDSVNLLADAGFDVSELRNPGRKLVVRAADVEYVIVRATDAPAFVASGAVDCGMCGSDSLIEANVDVVQLVDLHYGGCRFIVAEPRSATGAAERRYAAKGRIRVATKYPRITQNYYDRIGEQVEIIALHGNIELGPMVGMADRIVDITATGSTLRENDLVIIDNVIECSARFFANPVSLQCDQRVRRLSNTLAQKMKENAALAAQSTTAQPKSVAQTAANQATSQASAPQTVPERSELETQLPLKTQTVLESQPTPKQPEISKQQGEEA